MLKIDLPARYARGRHLRLPGHRAVHQGGVLAGIRVRRRQRHLDHRGRQRWRQDGPDLHLPARYARGRHLRLPGHRAVHQGGVLAGIRVRRRQRHLARGM